MRWIVRQRFGGEIYICHIPRLTPNLDLWLMMTMMIILRNIVRENVDGGNYVRDCVQLRLNLRPCNDNYTQKYS